MPSRSNRFSSSGFQQQMSFHENVGVLERSVSGAEVLLEKLAQDGESTALIVHGVEHAFGANEHSTTGIFEVNDRKCSGLGLWRNCYGLSVGQPVPRVGCEDGLMEANAREQA
nr:hypothetical protein [Tanacetum cinerariifolium]